jgi:hypothetical protein
MLVEGDALLLRLSDFPNILSVNRIDSNEMLSGLN